MSEQRESLVHVRGLRKSYGDFEAVRGIDLDVWQGEAFGFLGPNGAGKDRKSTRQNSSHLSESRMPSSA